MTTLQAVFYARQRLHAHLAPTPIEASPSLGEHCYLKLENLNPTRSFKIRGALNAVLALENAEKARGIVACSAGNHAQGIAYAAHLSATPATVVMPQATPQRKVEGARRYAADILLHGGSYDEAEVKARELAQQRGAVFVSPYNDARVVAGQGTIGLELFAQLPDLARVVVPVSGGGLLAGVALACKALNPQCEVIGVQSSATPAMYNYFYNTQHPQQATLAEGLAGEIEADAITLQLCRQFVDGILLVEESSLPAAIRWMLQTHNWVIEGAAAVGLAAFLTGKLRADERTTAIIISGANLDYAALQRILQA